MSNSTVVLLPPSTQIFVHALSHAAADQRLRIDPPTGEPAVFHGAGENVTMTLDPPGFVTPPGSGWACFTTPDSPEEYLEYTVTIESPQGSTLHTASSIGKVGPSGARSRYATRVVVSEDATDNDFNDSVLLFSYFVAPTPG